MEDLHDVERLHIKIQLDRVGYKIWIDDPEKCVLRAYRVGSIRVEGIELGKLIELPSRD